MAEIHPFRGVHYNESLVKDWPAVICPAYDIITPQLQKELYLRSEHNFVRLEFGRELPQDTVTDNKYARSAATLEQWLQQGILETDEAPAIYLYDQHFTHQGKEYKRRGIIARVRLEEWERMIVRPHEGTATRAKDDRLNLLRALQANTSPILAMFEDQGQQISSLLATRAQSKPLLSLDSHDGEAHIVWAITEPDVIDRISSRLAGQPLYIADGHHRYESALAYRREMLAISPSASGDEPFNFVMITMVDLADPGLVILPTHRLARGLSRASMNELIPKTEAFFEIDELPLDMPGGWQKVDTLLAASNKPALTLFGTEADRLFLLKLRDLDAARQMMPYFHSELYARLDVSIVDHIILEHLLTLSQDEEKSVLAYTYDRQDAISRVLAGEYQLALLISPVKAETIKAIADAGDRMPQKSTYFYPKLPAGLIFNRLI